jgi:hypothetical protein
MAANTSPIYSLAPIIQWGGFALKTANTTRDLFTGTPVTVGSDAALIFTADPTNGGYVQKIRFRAAGACTASVARIFINNGSVITDVANNSLYEEFLLPTVASSETVQTLNQEIILGFALPAGYRIYVTLGTTVVGGYYITTIGGKY